MLTAGIRSKTRADHNRGAPTVDTLTCTSSVHSNEIAPFPSRSTALASFGPIPPADVA